MVIQAVEIRGDIELQVVLELSITLSQTQLVCFVCVVDPYMSAPHESIAEASSGVTYLRSKDCPVAVGNVIEKILNDGIEFDSASKVAAWLC